MSTSWRTRRTAKAIIGVVSQSDTLDRSLTVWENLYCHGRYFGMGARSSRNVADQLLEVFRADRATAAWTLSGRGGAAVMVAREHRAQGHLGRRRARISQIAGVFIALSEIIRQIHADGQTVVLDRRQHGRGGTRLSRRRWPMDHGKLLALDSPDALERTVGGDHW